MHFLRVLRGGLPDPAIQLTNDFEMSEYDRRNMVYEKEHLLIEGPGKYPGYNYYRVAGAAVGGKDKGEAKTRNLRRTPGGSALKIGRWGRKRKAKDVLAS